MKKIFNKYNFVIFGITFGILIITLLAFYPGITTYDGNYQWKQVQEFCINDAHPFSSTYSMFLLSKIYNNIFIVPLAQILIISLLWTSICHNLRNNKNFIKEIIYTIIIFMIPIISLYSITVWKDVIYSYLLVLSSLMLLIGIKKDFKYTYIELFFLCLSIISIMYFRHNGIIITIGLIITYIFILKKYKLPKKKILALLCMCIIIITSYYIPKKMFMKPYEGESLSFKYSYPIFILGAYVNEDAVTNEADVELLNRVLPNEKWKEHYDPYLINGIVMNEDINEEVIKDNYKEIIGILLKSVAQRPFILVKHFLKSDSLIINPFTKGYVYVFPFSAWGNPEYNFDDITEPVFTNYNGLVTRIINITFKNEILNWMLYTPAIPFYISIFLAIVMSKKDKRYLLLILPMLLNTLSLLPTNVAQDLRYVYVNYLILAFLIGIFILDRNEKVNKKVEKIEKIDKLEKTLIIIPAYNEEKSIKSVVEDIYDKTENCDVIVINDGSKDNTLIEAQKTRATVIDLPSNLGIGGAVQTGYLYAQKHNYDIAIQVDADRQHNPEYINEMIEIIKSGQAQMVIGSRFVKKTSYKQTFFRMFGIKITSGIIKLLTGKRIYDTTSGFRAINKEIIEEFAKNYPYDYPEPCTNMEMILKGKVIQEIPVEMNRRETGVSSISPLKSVNYMFKVILCLFLMRIKRY